MPTLAAAMLASPLPQAQGGGQRGVVIIIQLLALGAIFYFVLIAPQRKEKKRHQQMLLALAKGDKILTNGGILGQIVHATERELTIKTGDDTRLVLDRGYVAAKLDGDAAGKGAAAPSSRPARTGLFGSSAGGLAGRNPKR